MRAAFLALLVLAAPSWAQSDAPVERPAVKPGDAWTYRRTDAWTNRQSTSEVRATFVSESAIVGVVKEVGREEADSSWTAEWNSVNSFQGGSITPHSGFFRFPLKVGDTYKAVFEVRVVRLGSNRTRHDRNVRIIGWEEVSVPAGKFRALKIEVDGEWQRLDAFNSGTAKTTIWYVPELKRWAKWMYEDRGMNGPGPRWGDELTEYKLQ